MQKMQEQFFCAAPWMADTPKVQEHFSAPRSGRN